MTHPSKIDVQGLSKTQRRMLDVLNRNNGMPMSVGLAELSSVSFSGLIERDFVGLYRNIDNIVFAHVTLAGRKALQAQGETEHA